MQGDTISSIAGAQAEQSLVIVVPKARLDLCTSLSHAFGQDAKVRVILDRRLTERRGRGDGKGPERRHGERRRRSDTDAELRAGRWVVVRCASGHIDFLDPDARAILFLCCGQHVVPCQRCQNTHRLSWIRRGEPGVFPCPLCGNDLTPTVVAHAQTCRYWVDRGAKKPPTEVGAYDQSARAASG